MSKSVPGLPARTAALRMIDAVLRRGEPLDQAASGAAKGLQPNDRALAIAIAQESFRWMRDIDLLIDAQTRNRLADDAKARNVIRMALAQMLRLETPPHAAIATALPLVTGGPKRLVHGILGAVFRAGAKLPASPTLAWEVEARWKSAWGADMIAAASQQLANPPMLDIALKDHGATAHWAQQFGGESLAPGHVRLPRGTAIEELPGFEEGAWWVQDLAATLPARMLGEGGGKRVLDLCAAPGGKTMQLAAAGWQVTALDKSAKRLERLSANLDRTGLSADIVQADVLNWTCDAPFDAVLIDAPCSATGTFRRHPDVLHRIGNRQIGELAELQGQMLDVAAGWLKPSGSLIFATCSLEPEEGEHQIARFLDRHRGFARQDGLPDILPGTQLANSDGDLRTLPHMLADNGGLDGFFASLLVAP